MLEKDPLPNLMPAWPNEEPNTVEDYLAALYKLYPFWSAIEGWVMDEQTRHSVKITDDGKVVSKMSDGISKTINDTISSYSSGYSNIQVPVLSFF